MANALASGIAPAQLGFLAIYNPGLGTTDETVHDQIVYYGSPSTLQASPRRRRGHRTAKDRRPTDAAVSREELNERLRQIGLAQGMVEFARSFAAGKPVDSIDTERSRVVLHELESGWWVLASIDLTRLPLAPSKAAPGSATTTISSNTASAPSPPPTQPGGTPATPAPQFEYSSREVKPAVLLLRDLLRAHSLFLLHHGPSLSSLLASTPRPQFTTLLARYWDLFLSTWTVLLHGNPACSVFGGIKIAACGELGIGVGEEDRGSGEREVLEGLVGRVDGLVDVVLGRFGTEQGERRKGKGVPAVGEDEGWLGLGNEVGTEDGALFLGIGALSGLSLRAVTSWMEDIYTWGEGAYGAVNKSGSRTKRRRQAGKKSVTVPTLSAGKPEQAKATPGPGEPQTSGDGDQSQDQNPQAQPDRAVEDTGAETAAAGAGMDKMFSYLKLGYGTYWSLGTSSPATNSDADDGQTSKPTESAEGAAIRQSVKDYRDGCFLAGLDEQAAGSGQPDSAGNPNPTRLRTVTVHLKPQAGQGTNVHVAGLSSTDPNVLSKNKSTTTTTLRPVVYVHKPFIYILLFHPDTALPPWEDFSQTLRTQLTPLHKPLLTSTAYRPEKPSVGGISASSSSSSSSQGEIYDLVFDPHTLALHSTIPNIPDPVVLAAADTAPGTLAPPPPPSRPQPQLPPPWTRIEALNTHNQILNMFASTRDDPAALELTCKTSRGWWVVWNRVLLDPGQSLAREMEMGVEGRRSSSSSPPLPLGGDEEGEGGEGGEDGGAEGGLGSVAEEEDDDARGGRRAVDKEIFLVRRASDNVRGVSAAASYVGGGGGGSGWADGASRLAQGIGVDTRRYIEGLLSLNR